MATPKTDPAASFFVGEEMKAAEFASVAAGQVAVFTTRSPEKADGKDNEDSIGLFPIGERSAVIAIADGSGGLPRGGEASKIAIEELGKSLRSLDVEADRHRTAILNGVENANRAIKALGVGAATTLVVAEIDGDAVRPYHIGDSGALVVGNRGKVRLQTIAHSPVGYAIESGMLDERSHDLDRIGSGKAVLAQEARDERSSEQTVATQDPAGRDGQRERFRIRRGTGCFAW